MSFHSARRFARTCAAALALLAVHPPAHADPDTVYALREPASYQRGCFGPCACPILSWPMRGSFHLVFDRIDPLFRYYLVRDFDALVASPTGTIRLQGSGTYRIGGEVAVQQQMTL